MKNILNKYFVYISYIFSSLISLFLDLTLFSLFLWLIDNIIISSYLARAISSFINYLLNKYKVFKYQKKGKDNTFIAYFTLVIVNITISALLVDIISHFIPIYATIIKVIVDLVIFILNFIIQKKLIFKFDKYN